MTISRIAPTLIDSGAATAGQVLVADGFGNASFADAPTPGLNLLGSYTANNDTSVDIGSGLDLDAVIDGTYDEYIIRFYDLVPVSSASLFMRISTDGGFSFDSGASDYRYVFGELRSQTATMNIENSNGTGGMRLSVNIETSGGGCNGVISIFNPSGTSLNKKFMYDLAHQGSTSGNTVRIFGSSSRDSTADIDALRLYMQTGNISSGVFYLYGIKKA